MSLHDDERINREIEAVDKLLARDYPTAVDYGQNETDEDVFDVFDVNGEVVATVTGDYITSLWNEMEGVYIVPLGGRA